MNFQDFPNDSSLRLNAFLAVIYKLLAHAHKKQVWR